MKNHAEGAAEWSNITIFCFPPHTIFLFFFFLLLFRYHLFQNRAEEPRSLAIAAIHESTMKRPYDSACMYMTFCVRLDDIALACSFHAVRIKFANPRHGAWREENKSTNCRLTDSRQTRERRGTSL